MFQMIEKSLNACQTAELKPALDNILWKDHVWEEQRVSEAEADVDRSASLAAEAQVQAKRVTLSREQQPLTKLKINSARQAGRVVVANQADAAPQVEQQPLTKHKTNSAGRAAPQVEQLRLAKLKIISARQAGRVVVANQADDAAPQA
ncbi:MAG: hypothetical protein WDW38_006664 [Sanguina aurantia]